MGQLDMVTYTFNFSTPGAEEGHLKREGEAFLGHWDVFSKRMVGS